MDKSVTGSRSVERQWERAQRCIVVEQFAAACAALESMLVAASANIRVRLLLSGGYKLSANSAAGIAGFALTSNCVDDMLQVRLLLNPLSGID